MRHGVVEQADCDQAGGVADVREEQRPHAIRDGPKTHIIPVSAIRRSTADDQFWLDFMRLRLDLVHVNEASFLLDTVEIGRVEFARIIDCGSVGQMPAVGQIKSQNGVARL